MLSWISSLFGKKAVKSRKQYNRLTEEEREEMLHRYKTNGYNTRQIASLYNIAYSTARRIIIKDASGE